MKNQHISREDVLRDFSVEFDSSKIPYESI